MPPETAPAITPEVLGTVLHRPVGIGQSPDGTVVVNSNRDQIEVHIHRNKLDVRDLSGELEKATVKVPQVVSKMMNILFSDSTPSIQIYGVNIVIDTPMNEPDTWIGKTFLKDELVPFFGSTISSNGVSIRASEDPKTILVKIESRENSLVNINFNASERMETLPSATQFAEDLKLYHQRTLRLIESLRG